MLRRGRLPVPLFSSKVLQFPPLVCAHCSFDDCGLRLEQGRQLFFLTEPAGSALNKCQNLSRKSECSCFALWSCATCVQCTLDNLCLNVWCGHTAVYYSIDLSPESKKHWFLRAGSILPFLAARSQFSNNLYSLSTSAPVPSLYFPPVDSFSNVHVCMFARPAVCGREVQRKADRHAVVDSHFPMVCISLACDHVIQAMTGTKRRKPSPALASGFSMCRYCQKLIGSHQFQEIIPIQQSVQASSGVHI